MRLHCEYAIVQRDMVTRTSTFLFGTNLNGKSGDDVCEMRDIHDIQCVAVTCFAVQFYLYLAIDSGGYMYEQPSHINHSIWLDTSQRN